MLALLRLALGWHFLYEGIWKIRHPDLFLAETEGFLSGARGPMAGIFYGMLPDIDGRQRLQGNLTEDEIQDADGKPAKQLKLAQSWDGQRQRFVDFYRPAAGKDDTTRLYEQLGKEAQKVYDRHVQGLNQFVQENGEKIKAHFESLQRYKDGLKTDPRTPFQRQRRWDEMQDLRKEAKGWTSDLDARETALKADLLDLLDKNRKSEKDAVAKAGKTAAIKAETKKPVESQTPTEAKKDGAGRRSLPRRKSRSMRKRTAPGRSRQRWRKPRQTRLRKPVTQLSSSISVPWPKVGPQAVPSRSVRIRFPGSAPSNWLSC